MPRPANHLHQHEKILANSEWSRTKSSNKQPTSPKENNYASTVNKFAILRDVEADIEQSNPTPSGEKDTNPSPSGERRTEDAKILISPLSEYVDNTTSADSAKKPLTTEISYEGETYLQTMHEGVITEVPEIILRCISRDEAALVVAQKVFKSLYENASDSTHIRVHLAILSAIHDVCKLVVKELTSWSLRGEFSACTTPTGFDPRDPFDMGIQRGSRMFNSTHQDMILRRKLEEAELQQALELQSRRLMGLELLDIKKLYHHQRNMSSGSAPICSPHSPHMNHNLIVPPSSSSDLFSLSSNSDPLIFFAEICGSPPSIIVENNVMNDEKEEFPHSNNHDDSDFHNSSNSNNIINSVEHNLPDSPFASPTKSGGDNHPFFTTITSETDKMSLSSSSSSTSTTNNSLIPSSLLPTAATSTLDISSYKLCFFPITRKKVD
ncbi:hypothetical protein GIB67_009216 [Kingdonia uniflora]|uniref:CCR4-NOT transcription complex subunit 1-like NOT1 connector domain-containing protein n=1 Tax=Kingdonia uniflora TaxID=39325 RepID=A0A7J7N2A4_9MAGN|nr:hypothetical protein GIB67_009216 [Kingdonia uniflora]